MRFAGKKLIPNLERFRRNVVFYLVDYGFDGSGYSIAEIVWKKIPPEDENRDRPPSFDMPVEAAQEFFEQLWSQGFRSVHDTGGADKLDEARREHIGDLRRAAKLVPQP